MNEPLQASGLAKMSAQETIAPVSLPGLPIAVNLYRVLRQPEAPCGCVFSRFGFPVYLCIDHRL